MSPSGLYFPRVRAFPLLSVSPVLSLCILELALACQGAPSGFQGMLLSHPHIPYFLTNISPPSLSMAHKPLVGFLALLWAFQSISITFCGNSGISTSFITGHFFFHASKNILAAGPHHLLGHRLIPCWILNNSIICVTTFCIKFPHSKYLEVFLFSWLDLNDSPFNISRLKLP